MAVGGGVFAFTSDHDDHPVATVGLAVPVGLGFVAAGLYAWHRRPENRTGPLMAAVGYTWFLGALAESDDSLVFSLGNALGAVNIGFLVWLVLAYPSGRLGTRLNRLLVGIAFFFGVVANAAYMLFRDTSESCAECPENAFLIDENDLVADVILGVQLAVGLPALAAIVVVLARRWRAASPPLRRALAPVFVTAGAVMVAVILFVIALVLYEPASRPLYWVMLACLLSVPAAFLLGLLRSHLARAGVSRLVVELGERAGGGDLRDAIARALNDPSLEIGYWLREQHTFVDEDGRVLTPPVHGDGRAATVVERRGKPIALLVHDAALEDDRALLDAVTAAAGLALENERRLQALAASERRSRALLDAIPDLMFRIRRDGTYVDFGAKRDEDLATPPDQVIGRTVRERLPPDVAESIMGNIDAALDEDGVQTCEYQLTLDGRRRYYEARIVASGLDEVLMIVREITERREALAALEAERDLIRTIVDTAPSLFCGVDPDGRIIRYNRALERLSGLPDDEATRGRPFWDVFVAPEDAAEFERHWREALGGGAGDRQSRWRTRGGGHAVVAWSVHWYPGEGGAERYLITGMDVTERHRQQEQLEIQRDFLDAIAANVPALLCLIDEHGVVQEGSANISFARTLECDPDDTGDVFWETYVAPEEAADVRARIERVVAGETVAQQDSEWLTRTGRRLLVAWSCTPLPRIDDRRLFLVSGIDVTLRHRQEEELRASRARLVEAGDHERRRLERNLHDGAQQRLVALSLALRLAKVRVRDAPDEAERMLTAAAEELNRALEELRELARGIHPAVLTDRGLAPALEALASRSPVPVEVQSPTERLPQKVEAAAYFVVSEALANVAKYARASAAAVNVERTDGRVVVEVRDDGVGGADPATGSGLRGLADRVSALDGVLDVTSPPGGGTRIRAEIPVAQPGREE